MVRRTAAHCPMCCIVQYSTVCIVCAAVVIQKALNAAEIWVRKQKLVFSGCSAALDDRRGEETEHWRRSLGNLCPHRLATYANSSTLEKIDVRDGDWLGEPMQLSFRI